MRIRILALASSGLFSCAALWGGQALHTTAKFPSAGISGRITIDETVGKEFQTNPIPKLKIYLLRVDDSGPLVELQQNCRRAMASPNADPVRTYKTCDQAMRQAVDLVPSLPSVATTETDRDGRYEFAGVPAAGRYNVVGVKMVEGAEPYVLEGTTYRLKGGERVTLNLSANDPWATPKTP